MKFQGRVQITNAAAMPEPVASPGSVPPASILHLPVRPPGGDRVSVLLLALEAPTAEGVTLDVFVVDEATLPSPSADNPETSAALAARRFYRIATGVVVAGGGAVAVAVPVGGALYLRRTADTLTAPRQLLAGIA